MRKILLILLLLLTIVPAAWALDLQGAKDQGLVGETASGYVEAVKPPSPEVAALVKEINAERKKVYEGIAKRNGTSLDAVERLAGAKAINKSKPGHYVNNGSGWVKK